MPAGLPDSISETEFASYRPDLMQLSMAPFRENNYRSSPRPGLPANARLRVPALAIFAFASLISFSNLFAAPPVPSGPAGEIVLKKAPGIMPLPQYSDFLYDPTGDLKLSRIMRLESGWFRATHDNPAFGFKPGVFWVRFRIRNQSDREMKLMIGQRFPNIDELRFYEYAGPGPIPVRRTGDIHPFHHRPYINRSFILPTSIQPRSAKTYYMSYRSTTAMSINTVLWSVPGFHRRAIEEYSFIMIFYGVILFAISYGAFLYFSLFRLEHLYSLLFIFAYLVFMMQQHGTSFQYLWPNAPWVTNFMPPMTLCGINLALLSFARVFLGTAKLTPGIDRVIVWLRRGTIPLALLGLSGLLLNTGLVAVRLAALLVTVSIMVVLATGIILTYRRIRHAYVFTVAFALVFIAGMMRSLHLFGVFPTSFLLQWAIQLVSLVLVSLLALSLADRVNALGRELHTMTEELEERVHERTRQLEKAGIAAEAANHAKSEFLANMSHEIRTPLNAVLGMAELMGETKLSQEQRKYTNILRRAGGNLLALINDILDLSKIEAGHIELESLRFNPRELAESVVEVLAVQADLKQLRIDCDIASDVPRILLGDPTRLRQILLNLLGNAVKFTSTGGASLSISTLDAPDPEVILRFRIADTGPGIPRDKQDIIFRPFHQADSSTTRRFGGTGLGLTISRRLIEAMGGEIKVESESNSGSTFSFTGRFTRPAGKVRGTFTKANEFASESESRDTPLPRVLLVEDNADNQLLITALLKETTSLIHTAENGAIALELFRENQYDLILMDMQMPVMDGYTATRAIREAENGNSHVPILALTAHAMREDVEKSLAAGCDAHLVKPINREILTRALEEHARPHPEKSENPGSRTEPGPV